MPDPGPAPRYPPDDPKDRDRYAARGSLSVSAKASAIQPIAQTRSAPSYAGPLTQTSAADSIPHAQSLLHQPAFAHTVETPRLPRSRSATASSGEKDARQGPLQAPQSAAIPASAPRPAGVPRPTSSPRTQPP